ncbi:DUF5329 family protein [Dokdonella sp. MW10]|uniref:DUF5329 family protein n=1 Tax=Dokdonella sp. MW10 TaxID=2992926 RepID=UPI003F80C13B
MRIPAHFLLLLLPVAAVAQHPPPEAVREIEQLFTALQDSGCRFFRNGSGYDADKATAHLRRKYEHLVRKGLVTSAEVFIDLAASKSSMSGEAYLVRCGDAEPVPGASWFLDRLRESRR